jgi:DUF1680 family protein
MERALYNGVISGMSLDGTRFFYVNPLASLGDAHRQEWFDCACCPPNLARLLASLGHYIYSRGESEVAVHLYIQGSARLTMHGRNVVLRQKTRYPWEGTVTILVDMDQPAAFGLRLRVPGWCRDAALRVNGEAVDGEDMVSNGYLRVDRRWQSGDRVELDLPMPVERMYAHPLVRQDAGCVALQRGPLVYCLEEADNPMALHTVRLPKEAPLGARFEHDLLGGVPAITGTALVADGMEWGRALYRPESASLIPRPFTAIPYYAWDNRQPGQMRVWIQEAADANMEV